MGRDYFTNDDGEGGVLDDEVPMRCNDCGRPTYYDTDDDQYHHAIDADRGCFLIAPDDRPLDLDHPLI